MTLIHFSDTHLGFNDLDLVTDDGINLREADFYDAFTQVIDAILVRRPDFVLHTGDLFHRPHPSNRAISFALAQFKRLSAEAIPTVIIAGNHSTPRTRTTSPILAALRTLDHVYPVFDAQYERIDFDTVVFHCIPHIHEESAYLEAIEQCEQAVDADRHNVLMLHGSVGARYLMEEYGERVYPEAKEPLFTRMDYVALGHWHGFGSVGKHPNVFYAGSTERTGSGDLRMDKGFVSVTLDATLQVDFQTITLRPTHRITVDAEADLFAQLDTWEQKLDTRGAVLYVILENLSALQSIDLTNDMIEARFPEALSVQVRRTFRSADATQHEAVNAASLQDYFTAFLEEQSGDDAEFTRLSSVMADLFARYDGEHHDA